MDLFKDPEFEKYRIREIEAGVGFLKMMFQGDYTPDTFRGAMAMLKVIINLPLDMIPESNESQRDQARLLRAKAFDAFEVKMMRRFIQEEE